ncbi:MAG: Uma2 family endonuclease [Lachnospiraceae bacterium]|nr:Uma2 family endonuclease [Lachnospiraceae bacterium]
MGSAIMSDEIFSVDYIEKLPESERAELVDGDIRMMSSPSRTHQKILTKLTVLIQNYIDSNLGKCEVYPAPFGVYIYNDDYNYFEPDISVICDTDKLDEKGCHGAPDWIIEIVSQSTKKMDYMTKLFKYQNAGVREYWIVDPITSEITVYDFENENVEKYTFGDKVKSSIYDSLEIDFAEIKKYL